MITIKWHVIKSNEDLPRSGKYVLVTKIVNGRRLVGIDTPMSLSYCVSGRDPYKDWHDVIWNERVIAWAELPEPYQGKLK